MMKRINRSVTVVLVLLLAIAFPLSAFANGGSPGSAEQNKNPSQIGNMNEHKQEQPKPWEDAKNLAEQKKDAIEVLKKQIDEQLKELEGKYEAAELSEDTTLMSALEAEIAKLREIMKAHKEELTLNIREMQEIMRGNYSAAELAKLDLLSRQLGQLANVRVIPVENVFLKGGNIKFDTPVVVKKGRTLIPARAVSEATGATVEWLASEEKVVITKGDKTIVFNLSLNTVYINDVEVGIDVSAELINSRTMVPLRFIIEHLGLNVEWDEETETINIS